jgi:nicotinate-nucleotide pyrophosphorylase (carboxylating)
VTTRELVAAALAEDMGERGDITSALLIPEDARLRARVVSRADGVLAGREAGEEVLRQTGVGGRWLLADGAALAPGTAVAEIEGPARAVLGAERTLLNLLCHLSGVATLTAAYVRAAAPAAVLDTRKTTPGLRALEKYAVRAGGGGNHRFGLDDAILIKDNHIALAGDIRTAIERAKAHAGHLVKIEVEVDTLSQLEQAMAVGVDAVLLDNMTVEQLKQAVAMTGGRAITEASGRITAETAKAIAATGVDLISAGWLTHSSAALDIGLDYLEFSSRPN